MKTIEKILVALDLTALDTHLIKYASFIATRLNAKKVYFVHNIKKYEISELFTEQLKEVDLEKVISEELDEKVSENFSAAVETEVLISEDPYTESLINYVAHKYMIDLVLVGNKNHKLGSGVIPDKLLRLLNCDILLVPQDPELKLDNIWIGTDFSKTSKKTFQLTDLLQESNASKVTAVHIYNVPIQFTPYLDREEMIPRIEKHTMQKFQKFIAKVEPAPAETQIFRGRDASVSEVLSKEAQKAKVDLLVVADKGGNVFSSLLVGSVTDELFNSELKIPLWVVK